MRMTDQARTAIASAREQFLALVESIRPELHRYCARLTGSVIEGEDIVQESLARAFYTLSLDHEVPELRPWLFRIAHNAALDFLKSHNRRLTDPRAEMAELAGVDEGADPYVARVALFRFLALPVIQRSAVILKDVLGHSLEETAATMETTVMAVKSALVRGRAGLRATADAASVSQVERAQLDRYASLFNARDWDGLRTLVGEDCRLDLVSKSQRRGKAVSKYFDNYARLSVTLRVVRLDGELVLGAYVDGAARASYFISLAWEEERLALIRDFRYVPYIADEASVEVP